MAFSNESSRWLHFVEALYTIALCASFWLLLLSRTGEAQTVWQVLHPAFLPTLFVATFLLFISLFGSAGTSRKLFFIILYSILIHSFFSIVFPAGDSSGQQMILGRTRRVFDNTILHGLSGWPPRTIQLFLFNVFRGVNLQAGLTTVLARTLSVDVLYVHLFLVPILWGTFVPIGSFLLTREVSGNKTAATLASLLISTLPFSTYFGAISVPNSLGFIFLLYSLYFITKSLSSADSKTYFLILTFSFFSFLAHFLTGIMSLSFLLLALAFKTYKNEKGSLTSKIQVIGSVLVCMGLLPVSFVYMRFFDSTTYGVFTLEKLSELPHEEIVGLFFLGDLIYGFDLKTIFLMIVGPTLAFICMIYLAFKEKGKAKPERHLKILFLFMAYLVVLADYRILKLFMEGLPINSERLWVIRDLIAAPFVGYSIGALVSAIGSLKAASRTAAVSSTNKTFKVSTRGAIGVALFLNLIVAAVLGGWVTFSLTAAYPQVAPLQTTWYELEAARHIEENTDEGYVVIGDLWTIYTGEVVVGINNPNAYYFQENSVLGHDLFANMSRDPSPQWMLSATNLTKTQVAYFIITEPRLGAEEFNNIVTRIQTQPLTLFYTSQNEKLRVYSYRDST